jgi:putative ABC transport system permease protein
MAIFFQDIRYALRQLRNSPGFTLFAIAIMALGIGANTVMFAVIKPILLRPLGYRDAERVVLITGGATPIRFEELKIASRSYSALAAFVGPEQIALSVGGEPEVLNGARVSANFLQVLGISPLRGAVFFRKKTCLARPRWR